MSHISLSRWSTAWICVLFPSSVSTDWVERTPAKTQPPKSTVISAPLFGNASYTSPGMVAEKEPGANPHDQVQLIVSTSCPLTR